MHGQARASFGQEKAKNGNGRSSLMRDGYRTERPVLKSWLCMCASKDGLVHSEGLSVYPRGCWGMLAGSSKVGIGMFT